MTYLKAAFDVQTLEYAKHVVLSNDESNPKKFEEETNFLIDVICENIETINQNSIVLDFGCGMGRVSRELIRKFNCNVFGVDISDSMLQFARQYVKNEIKFLATKDCPVNIIDVCISILVLQHTEDPIKEINKIHKALKPGGMFVLLNEKERFVPVGVDQSGFVIWRDDGINIHSEIEKMFTEIKSINYIDNSKNIIFYKKMPC